MSYLEELKYFFFLSHDIASLFLYEYHVKQGAAQ